MTTGMTPGRAAYEAFDAHLGPIDDPGYVGPHDVPLTPWGEVRSPEREAWEAAAQAAIVADRGTLTAGQLDAARAAYKRVCDERDYLRAAQGVLYRERAHLTAFLAACYPSVLAPDADDDEYAILYVGTPAGQLSWHVRIDDAEELLSHVQADDTAEWDGHSTELKYERLDELTCRLAAAGGVAGVVAAVVQP